MADPRNELADIIVPAAPEAVVAAVSNSLFLWAALGLVGLAAVALLAWLWRRRRPARAPLAAVRFRRRGGGCGI
ncbi:MAG: hypothetical protein KJ946_04480, partial [Gammaproteobacteria bacterium]|nr:hypothetical protein [Gammaproteobacteria bacterium]